MFQTSSHLDSNLLKLNFKRWHDYCAECFEICKHFPFYYCESLQNSLSFFFFFSFKAFKARSSVEYNGCFAYDSTDLKQFKYISLSARICDSHRYLKGDCYSVYKCVVSMIDVKTVFALHIRKD